MDSEIIVFIKALRSYALYADGKSLGDNLRTSRLLSKVSKEISKVATDLMATEGLKQCISCFNWLPINKYYNHDNHDKSVKGKQYYKSRCRTCYYRHNKRIGA